MVCGTDWSSTTFLSVLNTRIDSTMGCVEYIKQNLSHDSFRAATDDISGGLFSSRDAAADGHWKNWDNFWRKMDFDHLIISYHDTVPVLDVFAQPYQTSDINPRNFQVWLWNVDDTVCPIVQAPTTLGAKESYLTSQVNLKIQLRLQLRCY